mgnify:CR=1 FL=1
MTHLRKEIIPGIGDAVVASPRLSGADQEHLARKVLEQDAHGNSFPAGQLLADTVLPQTVSEPHPTTGEHVTILPIQGLPRDTRYVIADAINTFVSPTIIIYRTFSE